jgi:hypothetical protein
MLAPIHYGNGNPTAILMFLESGNTTRLLQGLPNVWFSGQQEMVAINRK